MKLFEGVIIDEALGLLMVYSVEGNTAELVSEKGDVFIYSADYPVKRHVAIDFVAFSTQVLTAINDVVPELVHQVKEAMAARQPWLRLFTVAVQESTKVIRIPAVRTYPYNRELYVKLQESISEYANEVSTAEAIGILEMIKLEILNNGK